MKPLLSVSVKYGLIASLLAIALIVLLYYTNTHPLLIPTFFDFRIILFALFIFFGVKEYKEVHNEGYIQFWQGMMIGVAIYVLVGLTVGLFIIGFSAVEPDFHHQYIEGTLRGLEMNKDQLVYEGKVTISEEEYDRQVAMLKDTPSYFLGLDYFIKSCLIGFFISIIMAVILRRSEKRFTK